MNEEKRAEDEIALEYAIAHAAVKSGLTLDEAIRAMSTVQEKFSREVDVRIAAELNYHFTVAEDNAAKKIVEYMQRYPYRKARDLYTAIELTMKFISDLKEAGIATEKSWEIISLAETLDCHRRG